MNASLVIELNCEPDKVVAITRHKTARFQKLLEVRKSFGHNLVSTDSVDPFATEPFCNSPAQIFIEGIPQDRSWTKDG